MTTDSDRFEKSLYDLIRGLRNHKGNENEYIQQSLRECRLEAKGADLDLKATSLLKLIYLEMFGHDMSWAAFHVLEVMSSTKYIQKRVGYLAAAQTFRTDTEVLMLATNLLKKDAGSPFPPTVSLPLLTIPHVITKSMAQALVPDLMPRLSHSSPQVRKKAVACIYRLALVYPDSLRLIWPKMKALLLDEQQDSSVVAAIVNVICELSWRRPQDFLPLAPKFFDFLVSGGNNWMAIKIIKLFASLIPLEPRLVKKLTTPLMNLIQTTPAMSLLYECINGIIEGGILQGQDNNQEADRIASLCLSKLRSMIVIDGDPNLKYVSLLAFNKIAKSHSVMVSLHEEVILACIDDPDVSIRLQALDLVAQVTTSTNCVAIIDVLLDQLEHEMDTDTKTVGSEARVSGEIENVPNEVGKMDRKQTVVRSTIPTEYTLTLIRYIINICARSTYNNIDDFDWYVGVLIRLYKAAPPGSSTTELSDWRRSTDEMAWSDRSIYYAIGWQLRNVAVRVDVARPCAVNAAVSLLDHFTGDKGEETLGFAAWITGEYIRYVPESTVALRTLLRSGALCSSSGAMCRLLPAILKVFTFCVSKSTTRTAVSFKRQILAFLDPLKFHQDLELRERAIGFTELLKVTDSADRVSDGPHEEDDLLLAQILPPLFADSYLKPVAPTAQRKVPIPALLDLQTTINPHLRSLLEVQDSFSPAESSLVDSRAFYYTSTTRSRSGNVDSGVGLVTDASQSRYWDDLAGKGTVANAILGTRHDRKEQHLEDPFYLAARYDSSANANLTTSLTNQAEDSLDIDSIPIMSLDIESYANKTSRQTLKPPKAHIAHDIDVEGTFDARNARHANETGATEPIDANNSMAVIEQPDANIRGAVEAQNEFVQLSDWGRQDVEMAKALAEVENLRLEMQRASDRIELADGAPAEGTLVKKRVRRKLKPKPNVSSLIEGSTNHSGSSQTGVSRPKKVERGGKQPALVAETTVQKEIDSTLHKSGFH